MENVRVMTSKFQNPLLFQECISMNDCVQKNVHHVMFSKRTLYRLLIITRVFPYFVVA